MRSAGASSSVFGLLWRDEYASQLRLGVVRVVVWREPRQWTLYTRRWTLSHPAHPGGHVPFSERYGYRKAYHLLGSCLARKGS